MLFYKQTHTQDKDSRPHSCIPHPLQSAGERLHHLYLRNLTTLRLLTLRNAVAVAAAADPTAVIVVVRSGPRTLWFLGRWWLLLLTFCFCFFLPLLDFLRIIFFSRWASFRRFLVTSFRPDNYEFAWIKDVYLTDL